MWVLIPPGGTRENSFFRETLCESAPGLPRIDVFGGSSSASSPETGAKARGVTPWVL